MLNLGFLISLFPSSVVRAQCASLTNIVILVFWRFLVLRCVTLRLFVSFIGSAAARDTSPLLSLKIVDFKVNYAIRFSCFRYWNTLSLLKKLPRLPEDGLNTRNVQARSSQTTSYRDKTNPYKNKKPFCYPVSQEVVTPSISRKGWPVLRKQEL